MKHSVETSCHGEERWLKGNIHVHTDEDFHDDISMDRDHGGEREWVIERSRLEPFCFDFICTSVHPYIESIDTFSQGEEREDIVIIPGRELQNDTIDNGGYEGGYFQGEAAKYLHVLTVGGKGGVHLLPSMFLREHEATSGRSGPVFVLHFLIPVNDFPISMCWE